MLLTEMFGCVMLCYLLGYFWAIFVFVNLRGPMPSKRGTSAVRDVRLIARDAKNAQMASVTALGCSGVDATSGWCWRWSKMIDPSENVSKTGGFHKEKVVSE